MGSRIYIMAFVLCMMVCSASAKKYRVHRIFGKGKIVMLNKNVTEEMTFDDMTKIRCTTNTVGMTVIDDKGNYFDFYSKLAYPKEMSMNEYLSLFQDYEREKLANIINIPLRAKGVNDETRYLYMLYNSITIGNIRIRKEAQVEVRWKFGEDTKSSKLMVSADKGEVYISRKLFVGYKPQVLEMEIWATDNLGTYRVKTIWVELVDYK